MFANLNAFPLTSPIQLQGTLPKKAGAISFVKTFLCEQ